MAVSNYAAINKYLGQFGIDGKRIPHDGWDETGYDYFPDKFGNQAQLRYDVNRGFVMNRERFEWPEGIDLDVLRALIAGEGAEVIPQGKDAEDTKPEPEQKASTPKRAAVKKGE